MSLYPRPIYHAGCQGVLAWYVGDPQTTLEPKDVIRLDGTRPVKLYFMCPMCNQPVEDSSQMIRAGIDMPDFMREPT